MSDLVTRPSAVVRAFVSPHVTRHRYNKRQSDFSALKEYNDYLEETEAIIFNLLCVRSWVNGLFWIIS